MFIRRKPIFSSTNFIPRVFTGEIRKTGSNLCTSTTANGNYERNDPPKRNSSVLYIPGIIACGCGIWQLKRMFWKQGLLEKREERLAAPPIEFQSLSDFQKLHDKEDLEYRQFSFIGKWDNSQEFLLGPKSQPATLSAKSNAHVESGFHLLTAFCLSNGGTILINRGWISSQMGKNKSSRPKELLETSSENQKITVVFRVPEKPGNFVPPNDPAKGTWFFVDPKAIQFTNQDAPTFYFEEICDDRTSRSPPIPKTINDYRAFSVNPIGHAGYAATWFSLAAGSFLMTYSVLKKQKLKLGRR